MVSDAGAVVEGAGGSVVGAESSVDSVAGVVSGTVGSGALDAIVVVVLGLTGAVASGRATSDTGVPS
jgi:hypothetical protein